jgi:AraC-like DNA-binding protein
MKLLPTVKSLYAPQSMHQVFLNNLFTIIEENIDASLNVEFLANSMAVSKSTLNRKLSMLTGASASELIKRHKLKRAIKLLSSGKNVSETAYLSGFETPSYFIQCFKEAYKITPKEYSKNYSYELL